MRRKNAVLLEGIIESFFRESGQERAFSGRDITLEMKEEQRSTEEWRALGCFPAPKKVVVGGARAPRAFGTTEGF